MSLQRRDLPAMVLFIASAILFAAFHFMRIGLRRGWEVWVSMFEFLKEPASSGPMGGIWAASFLMVALLIPSSPFLMEVWRNSRLAWWLAVVFSGLCAWVVISPELIRRDGLGDWANLPLGEWFLIASPFLNFFGLLAAGKGRNEVQIP